MTKHTTRILMKQTPLASKYDLFAGRFRPSGSIWTHSYSGLYKSLPHHPQVREHKQGKELGCVLLQSSVAHLGVTKLALDDPKRVFHLGTDAGLGRCHDRKLRYELTPRHNAFHEFKQFHLARAPGAQVQIKGLLVHARIVASTVGVAHASGEF
jgi:hypothetical protein